MTPESNDKTIQIIDMDIERLLHTELRSSAQAVKDHFAIDCKFVRCYQPFCDSQWKLNHLRSLSEQWQGSASQAVEAYNTATKNL